MGNTVWRDENHEQLRQSLLQSSVKREHYEKQKHDQIEEKGLPLRKISI
jgi:hypothetical protein